MDSNRLDERVDGDVNTVSKSVAHVEHSSKSTGGGEIQLVAGRAPALEGAPSHHVPRLGGSRFEPCGS